MKKQGGIIVNNLLHDLDMEIGPLGVAVG